MKVNVLSGDAFDQFDRDVVQRAAGTDHLFRLRQPFTQGFDNVGTKLPTGGTTQQVIEHLVDFIEDNAAACDVSRCSLQAAGWMPGIDAGTVPTGGDTRHHDIAAGGIEDFTVLPVRNGTCSG